MSTESVQKERYAIGGDDAASVARSIEDAVVAGRLEPDATLPSVRGLARDLGLSPSTVAAAYRSLRTRGVLVSHDRSRTVVAHRPPLAVRLAPDLPRGAVDLTDGNPDIGLLPDLAPALTRIDATQRLYGEDPALPALLDLARASFAGDGIPVDHLAIVGGALDGIERVLEVHCNVGDEIAMEDPGYAASLDLIRSLGLRPVAVPVDDEGMRPEGLTDALERGAQAVLLVPRAQNPTGAALGAERAELLRSILDDHPSVLVIEDDHAGAVAGALHRTTVTDRSRWAVVRSLSKSLGPDLRVAALTADAYTATRVVGRQRVGPGWVSHILQRLAVDLWSHSMHDGTVNRAAATYTERRGALAHALAERGHVCSATSGLNVWVPVPEEVPVVQGMASRGWGVQAGEPYRIASPPGVRITIARLPTDQAPACADALDQTLRQHAQGRRG